MKNENELIETFCNGAAGESFLSHYEEPLIKFVDHILAHALQNSASDIHIEPFENHCRIRYRQQGILYPISEINTTLATRLITRLKVMAQLNIAERRLPQDGHLQITHDQVSIDIRLNTCPTLFGEKVVLRILDTRHLSLAMDALGLTATQLTLFLDKLSEPQGLILVTGPTGSGKTVTLYSALHHLNSPGRNITTVEDPVEIRLPGINQVNIHPKIGLDFATILRTFLRQDPDVIMLGEIRDTETAMIATQAAQTGHLVLSTLHTNNAMETLVRLKTLGVTPNTISLILAQRLLRILCDACKIPDKHNTYRARGCQMCIAGYAGRTAIYEALTLTRELTELLNNTTNNSQAVHFYLQQNGFITLHDAALALVNNGRTSLHELQRVLRKSA